MEKLHCRENELCIVKKIRILSLYLAVCNFFPELLGGSDLLDNLSLLLLFYSVASIILTLQEKPLDRGT